MNLKNYYLIKDNIPINTSLVVVSKLRKPEEILYLYEVGHRVFGENRPLELKEKFETLPQDIEWHFIGHLQTNKIKYIVPFVSLIHSIDSFSLLKEVNRYAAKNNRVINCLLEFFIAEETSKFGFSLHECEQMLNDTEFSLLENVNIVGVMGMATFTDDMKQVRREFQNLKQIHTKLKSGYFSKHPDFNQISMGMSDDYLIAIEEGSTMIRVGSAIFRD